MRCAFRCTLSAVLLSTLLLLASLSLLLEQHFEDVWHQYHATEYVYHYFRTFLQHDPLYHSVPQPKLAESHDKVIVMARLAGEDTRWVDEHLWEYAECSIPSHTHVSLYLLTVLVGKTPFIPSTPPPPPPTALFQQPSIKAMRQWLTLHI